METSRIAHRVTAYLRESKFGDEIAAFYSEDIVSIEPEGEPAETRGRAAVAAKVQAWLNDYVVHGVAVAGPFVHGDEFIVEMRITMAPRIGGETILFEEAAKYLVRGGQVVEERFYC